MTDRGATKPTLATTPKEAREMFRQLDAGDVLRISDRCYHVQSVDVNEYDTPAVTCTSEWAGRTVKTEFRPSSGAEGSCIVTVGAGENDYYRAVRLED